MNVPSNITVFLVESRSFYRDLYLQSLGKLGLRGRCIISKSYSESISKLESISEKGERVDLIIIEAELCGEEQASLKLIELIRSKSSFDSAGVLLVSGEDDAQGVVNAFEKGADSYAFKPLEDQVLREKIEYCWLKRKRIAKAS
jgi:PleD family two-component response regulator